MSKVMTPEEFLKHHGVKGMKWGVRNDKGHEGERAKTKKIAKLDKKFDRELSGIAGYIKVNNAVAARINPRLNVLNAKPEYQGDLVNNPKLHKKYINEYRSELQKSLNEAMSDIGSNASGTQRVHIVMVGEGLNSSFEAYTEVIKHANSTPDFRIVLQFDNEGHIVDQKIVPADGSVAHADGVTEMILIHYGVPGMRWGVRKARTGNLGTRAARAKRYASGESKKAGGMRRAIDTASALQNYGINDLVKGRGLRSAAKRHAQVYEAERKRLALGEATAKDILKAYGNQSIFLIGGAGSAGAVAGVVRLAVTRKANDNKPGDSNRKA